MVFNVLNHSTGAAGVFGDCHLQKNVKVFFFFFSQINWTKTKRN